MDNGLSSTILKLCLQFHKLLLVNLLSFMATHLFNTTTLSYVPWVKMRPSLHSYWSHESEFKSMCGWISTAREQKKTQQNSQQKKRQTRKKRNFILKVIRSRISSISDPRVNDFVRVFFYHQHDKFINFEIMPCAIRLKIFNGMNVG